MTPTEVRDDLQTRLHQADRSLRELSTNYPIGHPDFYRLRGKAEGIRLALDYLRSYDAHLENAHDA